MVLIVTQGQYLTPVLQIKFWITPTSSLPSKTEHEMISEGGSGGFKSLTFYESRRYNGWTDYRVQKQVLRVKDEGVRSSNWPTAG